MKIWSSSHFSRVLLISYLAALLVPSLCFGAAMLWQAEATKARRFETECVQGSQSLNGVLERAFEQIGVTGYALRTSAWVPKVYSGSDVITRTIDAATRSNIFSELRAYNGLSGITDLFTVVLPDKGMVINSNGWYRLETFLNGYGITGENQEKLLRLVRSSGNFDVLSLREIGIEAKNGWDLTVLQNLDLPPFSRGVLLASLDLDALAEYIRISAAPALRELTLTMGARALYTWRAGAEAGPLYTLEETSAEYPLRYELRFDAAGRSFGPPEWGACAMILAAFVSLDFFLAALLARLTYRPVGRLLTKFTTAGQRGAAHEFRFLERTLTELNEERDELSSQVSQYYNTIRGNLLKSLTLGYFRPSGPTDELAQYGIPFTDEMFYQTAILRIAETGRSLGGGQLLIRLQLALRSRLEESQEELPFELLDTDPENVVLLCSLPNAARGRRLVEWLNAAQEEIRAQFSVGCDIYWGTYESGLLGISRSYQNAKESYIASSRQPGAGERPAASYYYPTDWEMQLIQHLKLGNEAMAQQILLELRRENHRRALPHYLKIRLIFLIMQTIVRASGELELEVSGDLRGMEEELILLAPSKQWERLGEAISLTCGRSRNRQDSREREIGKQMLVYLERNYADPGFSLQDLGSQFQMSVPTASRFFKSLVKINFGEYLCRIRMEKAKEYFRQGAGNVGNVAKRIGYENDSSFRRAFQRYEGVSPSEYLRGCERPAPPEPDAGS